MFRNLASRVVVGEGFFHLYNRLSFVRCSLAAHLGLKRSRSFMAVTDEDDAPLEHMLLVYGGDQT